MYRLFHEGVDLDLDSDDPMISSPTFPLIRDAAFIELMELCFSRSTLFSMTRAKWKKSADRALENELKPFLDRSFKTCRWFCYQVMETAPLEVSLYRATEESKAVLLKYFRELFLSRPTGNGEWEYGTQTQEDLCFFRGDELLLGTVTHEGICHVYPPDEAFESTLRRNHYWIPEEDGERFDLSKLVLWNRPAVEKQELELKLTRAEALVLHDLLNRISGEDAYYEDAAEQYVLWSIECQLEKELVEPSMENYAEIIQQSRKAVREGY